MLVDRFHALIDVLAAEGWEFTSVQRYDPTIVAGVTPTGKAFTVTCAGDTVTVTVNGNTRTLSRPKAQWLDDGPATVQALRDAYARLPSAQR